MKLSRLISRMSYTLVSGSAGTQINNVICDSRLAKRGAVFVAIKGAKADGHDYIKDAYRRGARVFVVSRKIENFPDSTVVFVKNTRKALAEMCSRFYGNPQKGMKIIGVTGTKGKSTTLYLAYRILQRCEIPCVYIGTLGVYGVRGFSIKNTTPDPTELYPILAAARRRGIVVLLIEVSSQALKDFRLYRIPFSIVALTEIGYDHISKVEHKDFEDYVSCKRTLFTSYGARQAIINADDRYAPYFSRNLTGVKYYGTHAGDYFIEDIREGSYGVSFSLNGLPVRSSLLGKYNVFNITLALVISSLVSKMPLEKLAKYVEQVSVPGRFQTVNVLGRNVIIDYAHTPESIRRVAESVRHLFRGKIFGVLGSVGGRAECRRRAMGRIAEKYFDFSIITVDDPGEESPYSICNDILDGFSDKSRATVVLSRREAIKRAIDISNRGDSILLLGKGHEQHMLIGNKRYHFSEEEILYEIAGTDNGEVR